MSPRASRNAFAANAALMASASAERSATMVSTRGGSARANKMGPNSSKAMISGAVSSESQKPQAPM
jgi:hypothetical protein